ncbi:hypothetical protein HKCCE3408_12610 [Rhodobacterales bacterium HKCCE3408]|nr:hypothetical protein [Rhodobacterales bacterium HKCCE3408]
MSWTTIWDRSRTVLSRDVPPGAGNSATFLVEDRLSRANSLPQRIWTGGATAVALAVDQMPDGRIALSHGDMTYETGAGLVAAGDRFRLSYRVDAAGRSGVIDLRNIDSGAAVSIARAGARPLRIEDVRPARAPEFAGIAAFANHDAPAAESPGLASGTLVSTPRGNVPVEDLHPGAVVLTDNGRPAVVRDVKSRESVTLGAMAAVRLRAPYFGLEEDICVARHTRFMLSGPDVDYVLGTDQTTVAAGDLVDGRTIVNDLQSPVREFHTIDLDRPGCLVSGRCRIAGDDRAAEPYIAADRFAAQAVMSMPTDALCLMG